MIEFTRPCLLFKAPPKRASRFVFAFNRPTVMDPASVFTHHIELHAWIGRLYFGGVRLYWNVNQQGLPTSDAFALYSSRLYTQKEVK